MSPTVRGGLPRAPDGTGQLSVVRPGQPKGRTAVFGQDGGPYRVGDGRGWPEMVWDCWGRLRTAWDGGGLSELLPQYDDLGRMCSTSGQAS